MKNQVACDDDSLACGRGVDQLSLPLPGFLQLSLNLRARHRKFGLEQLMRDLPDRLLAGITVEPLATDIPQKYPPVLIEHEHVREVQDLRLLPERGGLAAKLFLVQLAVGDVHKSEHHTLDLLLERTVGRQATRCQWPSLPRTSRSLERVVRNTSSASVVSAR